MGDKPGIGTVIKLPQIDPALYVLHTSHCIDRHLIHPYDHPPATLQYSFADLSALLRYLNADESG